LLLLSFLLISEAGKLSCRQPVSLYRKMPENKGTLIENSRKGMKETTEADEMAE
jgi:hypothetical protein